MEHRPIQPPRPALARRLLPLAYALVAVVVLILMLAWVTVQAQIALAGYLNGESLWSKAQKQVTVDLLNYADTGNEAEYLDFQRHYVVIDALKTARTMVLSGKFQYRAVEDEMRRGHAMTVAIPAAIFMMHHFSGAPFIRRALQEWSATDQAVAELGAIGQALHREYTDGTITAAEAARQRGRIVALNAFIGPYADQFSLSFARGAVWTGRVLFVGILMSAALAIALWLWMARRVLAGIRGSEERYRVLFDSAPDAIVMVDETSGRVVDANRVAGEWTGQACHELVGTVYEGLFEEGVERKGSFGSGELRSSDGPARPVEIQSSMTSWGDRAVRQAVIRDISERMESDRAKRVAAEALASIVEGVVITDPLRRVVSANAAASQITGFSNAELVGTSFDATRIDAAGAPLPESIWEHVETAHHWSGEVRSRRRDGSLYAEKLSLSTIRDQAGHIMHFVAAFSDISDAKATQDHLEHLATHDALTGLVNRVEFQRCCGVAIERAAREHNAVAVMFIDLDAFKFVNDSYSHAAGDRLLALVAQRIRHQLRDGDIAGRIGGDEFTVMLPGLLLREDATAVARRVLAALSEPFRIDDYEIVLTASIGIAGYPLDGNDAKTLIANADAAMYVAKAEERNTWRFYAPMMQANARQRMTLATELRQALAEGQFHLAFQPSVEMSTGRIVAAEALLRWQHPERGEVMPDEFIPVAESIGLIHRVDEWVLHTACAQIHAWDLLDMPRIRIAINVSARWLGHPAFVGSVERALRDNSVDPERVVLEITEGAMLRLGEDTERTLRALRALGIGVAIDDFGTGYAAMAYLKLPAVKYLKIDRSFVSGLPGNGNDAAITTAMVAMANSLGLATIAEGVETDSQHEFLLEAGCTEGQGYLYAYPLPPSAIEHMLRPNRKRGSTQLKLVSPQRG